MAESFSVGDLVEIISVNEFRPMPGGLGLGSRGTVMGVHDSIAVVDYGIGQPVWSRCDSIRKIRPPQDWVKLCNLNDTPRALETV